MSQRDFTEGADSELARLKQFVDAMPYKEQNVTKLWFGICDGYRFSLSELAAIFKSDVLEMEDLVGEIETKLDQAGLLVSARKHRHA